MRNLILLVIALPFLLACRPEGSWWSPPPKAGKNDTSPENKYFSSGSSWGSWNPPEGNNEWTYWIDMWGKDRTTDKPESDEWGSQRGPESGWPQGWRGYGPGIGGVPPPPWAYVPKSYDKPELCFRRPRFGHCSENVTRWSFNPTNLQCQTFFYSGCGGNDNNFMSKALCEATCVDTAAPDCEIDPAVNFEEMINQDFSSYDKDKKHN